MSKVALWGIVVVVVLGILAGAVAYRKNQPGSFKNSSTQNSGGALPSSGAKQESATKTDVPSGTKVPAVGGKVSDPAIAVPVTVTSAAPGATTAKFRSFNLTVSGNSFLPNTVIVNEGDTVRINFTAQDKNYDFAQPDYGLSQTLVKGKLSPVEFQANMSGKFTFFCTSCGGPSGGPVGYIIVVQ